jgi:hypothetical protein
MNGRPCLAISVGTIGSAGDDVQHFNELVMVHNFFILVFMVPFDHFLKIVFIDFKRVILIQVTLFADLKQQLFDFSYIIGHRIRILANKTF